MTWIRAASNRSCLDLSCYRSCLIPHLKRLCLGPSYYKRDLRRPLHKSCLGQSCYKSYLYLVVTEGPSSGPGYPFQAQVPFRSYTHIYLWHLWGPLYNYSWRMSYLRVFQRIHVRSFSFHSNNICPVLYISLT